MLGTRRPPHTAHLNPIDNIDFSLVKRFNVYKESWHVELGARFYNLFNHSQWTGSRLNDVASIGYTGVNVYNFLNPNDPTFYRPDQVFSSNPRSMQLTAKFTF